MFLRGIVSYYWGFWHTKGRFPASLEELNRASPKLSLALSYGARTWHAKVHAEDRGGFKYVVGDFQNPDNHVSIRVKQW